MTRLRTLLITLLALTLLPACSDDDPTIPADYDYDTDIITITRGQAPPGVPYTRIDASQFILDGIWYIIHPFDEDDALIIHCVFEPDKLYKLRLYSEIIIDGEKLSPRHLNSLRTRHITHVNIPPTVCGISAYAFEASRLETINLPPALTIIPHRAFCDCDRLREITLPETIRSIDSGAFSGCTRLSALTIPENVTSIGSEAFSNCEALTSLTIPDKVTSIGAGALSGCTSLKTLSFGKSVKNIGPHQHTPSVEHIYCHATAPPRLDFPLDTFHPTTLATATIHVPAAALDEYLASDWNTFRNIIGDL